jgi:hypothetical protein
MALTIDLFGELTLEPRLQEGKARLVAVFPDRPLRPHLTVFYRKRWRRIFPHFTAGRDRPDQVKKDLPAIDLTAMSTTMKRFEREALEEYAAALQPVNLIEWHAAGWWFHWADMHALQRWVRWSYARSNHVLVDDRLVHVVLAHVARHRGSLEELAQFDFDTPRKFIMVRPTSNREDFEIRSLFFCPDGFGVERNGEPVLVHERGWYTVDDAWSSDDAVRRTFPIETVVAAFRSVHQWLQEYPRRRVHGVTRKLDRLEEIAPGDWKAWSFYATDLLAMLLDVAS